MYYNLQVTTLIAIEVMVDFEIIGKPKFTAKFSPWMALFAMYGAKFNIG